MKKGYLEKSNVSVTAAFPEISQVQKMFTTIANLLTVLQGNLDVQNALIS
jgi:flagellar basal body rod protein FlgG